jgi:hypothetical protein
VPTLDQYHDIRITFHTQRTDIDASAIAPHSVADQLIRRLGRLNPPAKL